MSMNLVCVPTSLAYQASPTRSKRFRSTKSGTETLQADLLAIIAEMKPMTVRQVYYQAVVRGLVDKTEATTPRSNTISR